MKNKALFITITIVSLIFTSCSKTQSAIENEIKIPIYESSQKTYDISNTVTAATMDLVSTEAVPASIGYLYADEIRCQKDSNILEWNAAINGKYNKGDILAVLDASPLTYDYNNQKTLTDSVEQNFLRTGSETDKLKYLIMQKELERIEDLIDDYIIKAPYDCVVVSTERHKTGDTVQQGDLFFSISRTEDVYIYCNQNTSLFRLGSDTTVRLNNTDYYGKVVSCPASLPVQSSRSMRNTAIIKMNPGELERLLADIPNAVTAGWATVYVTSAEKYNVLAVPEGAVKNYNGKIYCNVVQNNEIVQVNIETELSINGFTVILSGLDEGDVIYA